MAKISVIVPVYNVEPYLRKCIESIIHQTLEDIEIILVDDGSLDRGGAICDEYAAYDKRIRVFHKPNEGLSSARNDGIKMATAPYIMFVDSDDWVSPDFCELPYRSAKEENADLVIFRATYIKDKREHRGSDNRPNGIVDVELALRYGGISVWNKLYKRELFSDICFPKGRVYEDIAVTHKLVLSANRIMMIPDYLYYWLYRKDSLSHIPLVKNRTDGFLSAIERAAELKTYGFSDDIYMTMLVSHALALLAVFNPTESKIIKQAENVADSIEGIPRDLPWIKKTMLIIWKTDKKLFHTICKILGQKEKFSPISDKLII